MDHVICCDEVWFYTCYPHSRHDNRVWCARRGACPSIPLHEQSTPKTMLCVFFAQLQVYHRFIPQGHGVNGATYLQILQEMREAVRRHRPQIWRQRRWGLLHDGAPAHRCDLVQNWLNSPAVNIPQLPHPPYSPNLNPPDYWLFRILKRHV